MGILEKKPSILGVWICTEKQLKKIKNNNNLAINKFFNDNYKIIYGMARKFFYNHIYIFGNTIDINDLINQVYIDLPLYNFDNKTKLYYSIVYGSFYCINYGGISAKPYRVKNAVKVNRSTMSYDQKVDTEKDNKNINEIIFNSQYFVKGIDDFLIDKEDKTNNDLTILEYIKATIHNKKDFNYMFCKLFTDLPLESLTRCEYEQINQWH